MHIDHHSKLSSEAPLPIDHRIKQMHQPTAQMEKASDTPMMCCHRRFNCIQGNNLPRLTMSESPRKGKAQLSSRSSQHIDEIVRCIHHDKDSSQCHFLLQYDTLSECNHEHTSPTSNGERPNSRLAQKIWHLLLPCSSQPIFEMFRSTGITRQSMGANLGRRQALASSNNMCS